MRYSNVVATFALFIALGGTSYAITKLPRNSVGSAQVRDGSLQRQDLARTARPARGPRGPQGPGGSQGPAGERGPSNVRIAPQIESVVLSGAAGVEKQVRRMDNVPAGAWVLRFLGSPQLPAPTGLHTYCDLKVNGDVKAIGATVVGDGANATQESGIAIETAVDLPAPFNVAVDCNQTQGSTPAVTLNRPQIIATQVGSVVTSP